MVPRRTVLLVEDDDDLRRLYRQVLLMAGYRVLEARGGYEALQRMESELPGIVVLDLGLPGIDGTAVHRELAARIDTGSIPILVVTGSPDVAANLDVNCVLVKPITAAQLLDAVANCLGAP